MESRPNYYEILDLQGIEYALQLSPQELKAAYRRALLQHHPDKSRLASAEERITVDDVALAYKTLSEPKLKAEYDRWLQSNQVPVSTGAVSRPHHTGLETVDLDDLVFNSKTDVWERGCRCGNEAGFVVTEADLEKNVEDGELIIGCKGCSLWLRVLFGVEE